MTDVAAGSVRNASLHRNSKPDPSEIEVTGAPAAVVIRIDPRAVEQTIERLR
jgi:hypothetical protein